jgi:DNA polymerase
MCSDYLENELSIIKPKIICLMGNTAYNSILQGKEISKNHGRIVYKKNRVYFITFHPAALIYNKKLEKIFNDDIKKLVITLRKLNKKIETK